MAKENELQKLLTLLADKAHKEVADLRAKDIDWADLTPRSEALGIVLYTPGVGWEPMP